MSRFLTKLNRLVPFGRNKPVGYDLQGNRYYEVPSLVSERPRRTIEYKIAKEPNEYTVGDRMPVQWAAWLSHTRSLPPTLPELQADVQRLTRLAHNVALIEARDAEEVERRRLRLAEAGSGEVGSIEGGAEQGQAVGGYPVQSTGSPGLGSTSADANDPNAPVSPTLRQLSQQRTEEDRARLAKEGRGSGAAVFGTIRDGYPDAPSQAASSKQGKATGLFDAFVPLPASRASEAGRMAFPSPSSSTAPDPSQSTLKPRSRGASRAYSTSVGLRYSMIGRRLYTTGKRPDLESGSQSEFRDGLGSRLSRAWSSTPIKWYPIPIALGAAVLLAVQYRKATGGLMGSKGDRVEVNGEDGEVVVKGKGPWQVSVLGALPLRSLSQLWGYLNGLVLPVWFRPTGFRIYSAIFGCDLEEAEYDDDLAHYKSLGEFFYRRLKEGRRVVDASATLVSPADGRILHFGEIDKDKVEQVKGMTYSLDALLGASGQSAEPEKEVDVKRAQRVSDDENFAEINEIPYSLSKLLGASPNLTQVSETSLKDGAFPVPARQNEKGSPHDASIPMSHDNALGSHSGDVLGHDAGVAMELGSAAFEQASSKKQNGVPKIKDGNKLFFCVIYLAPGDYHRFHSPAPWVVERRRHFTGDLFSVSPYIANRLKDLFVLNERVALLGRWKYGFFSMVPVGATNVGSIKINFDESLRTNERYPKHPPHTFTEAVYHRASSFLHGQPLHAGEEMGGFMLGSTIVMVFEAPEGFRFTREKGVKVKVGEGLGVVGET